MTEKELLYIEDALSHEAYFKTKCCETMKQIKDEELKSYVQEMADMHCKTFDSFYSLLN